jgi:T5SS/PEP-CTERM-associated repeat protein
LAAFIAAFAAAPTGAAVTAIGDVLPADNPLTDLVNEGLPPGGNTFDSEEPPNAQTQFENNDVIPGYEDIDAGIVVGQKSFGRLDIDGNSKLRYETLVIGDEGDLPNGQTRKGTGFMLITGIDALYNNDPNILPAGLPPNFGSTPDTARADDIGFDLYVGRFGQGTLQILSGGRAEIQDAAIIGDQVGSLGTVTVDGFATYLGSGGFEAGGGPIGELHQMVIGHLGTGTMNITNGGTVINLAVGAIAAQVDTIAAVIGGDPFDLQEPLPGGSGIVNVVGPGSTWTVGGTLQIGAYDNQGGLDNNIEGTIVEYDSSMGHGTLNVSAGGVVSLTSALGADPTEDPLRMTLGRFGRIHMDGGYISIGDPGTREDNVRLINDGVIEGHGQIVTGLFRNRYFGEIRVNPGQKLLFDATSEVETINDLPPWSNWGLIEVIGTPEARSEIEFERALSTPEDPVQPFRNLPITVPPPFPTSRVAGQITAAHSTLRFRSGLSNAGKLSFIAGDNLVVGPVVNEAEDVDDMLPPGFIIVAGNQTTVTFEDEVINNGVIEIFPDASLIYFVNDLVSLPAAQLSLTLGGGQSGQELSFISVGGDALLDGTLEVKLFSSGNNPIIPQDGDQFQILAAAGDVLSIFSRQVFPALPPDLIWNINYDRNADTVTLLVQSLLDIMGADFNGDGFVDLTDLAIWEMFVGITSGATPAQGDADLDGDVDGDDLAIWQQTIGPVPASGGGSGQNLNATVPEPSAVAMLLSGGLLALVARRRR